MDYTFTGVVMGGNKAKFDALHNAIFFAILSGLLCSLSPPYFFALYCFVTTALCALYYYAKAEIYTVGGDITGKLLYR